MEDIVDSEGDVFLARVQNEGHVLLERDLRDFRSAGINTDVFTGNSQDIARRARAAWILKRDPMFEVMTAEIARQGLLAWNIERNRRLSETGQDEAAMPWRQDWDERVHSETPLNRLGRSGRGVIWSIKQLTHINLLGIAVGMVNRERINAAALIAIQ
jgi:hypothetical protein